MEVTVDLVGGDSHEVSIESGTYEDLLSPLEVSKHEVTLLVDGRPVPEDESIDESVDEVQVLRLIRGG